MFNAEENYRNLKDLSIEEVFKNFESDFFDGLAKDGIIEKMTREGQSKLERQEQHVAFNRFRFALWQLEARECCGGLSLHEMLGGSRFQNILNNLSVSWGLPL